jgi:hypothetical protein
MPFDDLDLEFEDEEESKKKKSDAVQVDVDLEFQAPEGVKTRQAPPRPPNGAGSGPDPARSNSQTAEVRKIDEARAQIRRPESSRPVPHGPAPRTVGANAIEESNSYDVESQQIVELREQVKKVQLEADVKVGIAEFKADYLTDLLSDMKLMEHQIGQLLVRINAKHPDMKNEVLMIKKILADFMAKKRK